MMLSLYPSIHISKTKIHATLLYFSVCNAKSFPTEWEDSTSRKQVKLGGQKRKREGNDKEWKWEQDRKKTS